jgi:hypothetical protein
VGWYKDVVVFAAVTSTVCGGLLWQGSAPATAAAPCYQATWTRTVLQGTTLHPHQGWLRYDCESRTWSLGFHSELALSPPITWPSSKLRALQVNLNTDGDTSTGCGTFGDDYVILGTWNGSALVAEVRKTETCAIDSPVVGAATLTRLGTQDSIEIRWNQRHVGYPRAFVASASVSATDDPQFSTTTFTIPARISVSGFPNPGWANAFSGGSAPTIAGAYEAVVGGDFNGDGRDDVLFYGAGGKSDSLWLGTATKSFVTGPKPTISGTFDFVVSGDFNGDGRDDVLLHGNGPAKDVLRLGTSTGALVGGPALSIDGTFTALASDDFNGDGFDDVLFYGSGASPDVVRLGNRFKRFSYAPPTTIAGVYDAVLAGDFNGNGRGDVFFYGAGGGGDALRLGTATGTFVGGPAVTVAGTYTPATGDFDGNGRAELLWYSPGPGTDLLWQGRTDGTFAAGRPVSIGGNYVPVVGDFNGDGRDDILLYGPGSAKDATLFGSPPN